MRVQCDFERSGLGSNTYVLPGHDPRNRNWKFRLFDQGVETGMAWLIQHEWRPSSAGLFIISERGGGDFFIENYITKQEIMQIHFPCILIFESLSVFLSLCSNIVQY